MINLAGAECEWSTAPNIQHTQQSYNYNRLDYDIRLKCVTPGSANAQTRPTPDRLVTSLPSDGTCAPLDFPERVSRELTQNSSKIKRRDTNIQRNDTSTALYVSFT